MNAEFQGIGMTSQRTRDRLIDRLQQEGIRDARVLEVLRTTPRHLFMDEAISSRAYEDTALPIGHGQTISQPYIVARMTEALIADKVPDKVLEVGTGSGYQTAILAPLIRQVYTVERIGPLLEQARQRLANLNLNNIQYRHDDGYQGWPQYAPYEAIIVTAAPLVVPEELLTQLADGGRMVIPVGASGSQKLLVIQREGSEFARHTLDWVSFVPLKEGKI